MILLNEASWSVKQTPQKGRGIVTHQDILPGVVIGDYLGKIIHPDDEDEQSQGGLYAMSWHEEIAYLPADLTVDDIHCMNHSCAPNCCIYPHHGHMLFVSLRKIFAGEELTVSYMINPIPENKNNYLCSCGEAFCSGTMFCNSIQGEAYWGEFVDQAQAAYISQLPARGQTLLPLDKYPTNLPYHPIFNLFGNTKLPPQAYNESSLPDLDILRERIRTTGLTLCFPKLNLTVLGTIYPKFILIKYVV